MDQPQSDLDAIAKMDKNYDAGDSVPMELESVPDDAPLRALRLLTAAVPPNIRGVTRAARSLEASRQKRFMARKKRRRMKRHKNRPQQRKQR